MEARSEREVKDGSEYDSLFPPPDATDITVKKSADVEDTLALIQKTVPQTLWQTKKIAQKLKGKTLDETCSNIWHFVYDHIKYKKDKEGVEQVRSPRRTWWERHRGVDCDCYTEFICSILLNLNIPHKARITKYPKRPPEVPRWQHIYPVVPLDGDVIKTMNHRDDYIVLDCVKDEYDNEQPFLECKDYDMRLDYLDGIDDGEQDDFQGVLTKYTEHENVDVDDLSSIDDEEMGNIFKKIGGAVKKTVKKVGDKIGDGVRFLNRYANPATILLRNGFLLAMKVNLMNVAGRLRFAYLTDAQAKAMNMNPDALKKVRSVKDRAETVYWQAGGKKENLKKAILKGKGNKDKKVSINGLFGLDDVYADLDEYNIIHNDINDLGELGDPASGAALAAATSAVAAISGALKQVKGLFNKGGKDEQAFQSETENSGSASANMTIPEDEEALINQEESSSASTPTPSYETPFAQSLTPPAQSAVPASASAARRSPATTSVQNTQSSQTPATQEDKAAKMGFVQRTTEWVKKNPGKTLLIAGAVAGGTYLLLRPSPSKGNLNGLSGKSGGKRKRKASKRKRNRQKSRQRIESVKL